MELLLLSKVAIAVRHHAKRMSFRRWRLIRSSAQLLLALGILQLLHSGINYFLINL
jgi:hypothetical protein